MIPASENKIIDYISGIEVIATPEETEAVQVFSRQLVEDYGYQKEQIQTRPQFRVKARPSDTKKEYPIGYHKEWLFALFHKVVDDIQ